MAFGKNYAEDRRPPRRRRHRQPPRLGRARRQPEIATDESYIDRNSGQKVDKTEWHRVVTFQDGLIDMLEKHATKGRLISVEGKMQTRRWRKPGEDSDRFSTEILVVPGNRVQFYDKPNGGPGRGRPGTRDGADMPSGGAPAATGDIEDPPF